MYYVLQNEDITRKDVVFELSKHGIHAVFRYIPLNSSPAVMKIGKCVGNSNAVSSNLFKVSFMNLLVINVQDRVVGVLRSFIQK